MLKKLNIHCYSYLVKKQVLDVCVLTVIVSAKLAGMETEKASFASDESLSKHESGHFSLHISNRQIGCGSYFGV